MPNFALECDRFYHAAREGEPIFYSAYAIATNFNTTMCILAPPPNLRSQAKRYKRFILEGISLYVAAGAGGVTAYPVLIPCVDPIQYWTGERKMTAYATDSLVWSGLHIPVDLDSIVGNTITLVSMNMDGYAPTDDLTIYLWGYLE